MFNYRKSRDTLKDLINIFNIKSPKKQKLEIFERDVKQVIDLKSDENFELFATLFDLLINNREKYSNGYTRDNVASLYREYISKSKKRGKKFTSQLNQYSNYGETIKLVIRVYNFVTESFVKTNHNTDEFDVFLSHKYSNKYFNLIVFYVLHFYYGLSVYVDWIHDHHINRLRLSRKTVDLLSKRLNQSRSLLFFNMEHSVTTNWMAWEVGYFSGKNRERVGVLDLSDYYGKNKTSIEVLSSAHRFIYKYCDIVDEKSWKIISEVFG